MYSLIALVMAIAPALYLLHFYNKQDKAKPEPTGLIVKVFFYGVVSIIPVLILELIVQGIFSQFTFTPLGIAFAKAFFVAALCEEWMKRKIVRSVAYDNPAFDEVMDGVVYTVVASLGFACFENVIYVMGHGMGVAILRAFTAIPMHAFASGIMGYYIGKAKFAENAAEESAFMQRGLFLAFMIHGMYDFALFSVPVVGSILPALMVFPLLRWCYNKLQILIKDAIEEDSQMGRIDTPIVTVADTDTENDLMNIPPLPPEDFIDT